jgi:peroxiredoxin Q/BCP
MTAKKRGKPTAKGAKPRPAAKKAAKKSSALTRGLLDVAHRLTSGRKKAIGLASWVGRPAPPFTLLADDGRTYSLGDWAGRWLVLFFFPKADTPG